MKKFSLILIVLFPVLTQAQVQSHFSNGIFKSIETDESQTMPLHISDFRYQNGLPDDDNVFDSPRQNPGIAFAASALIPGSGQAINGKWVRAGIYFTAEVVGLIYHFERNAAAKRQERAYEAFTHENWSVVAYAEWLVNYSQQHGLNNGWQQLQSEIQGEIPDYLVNPNDTDTRRDWSKVNISTLHSVENQTPFYYKDRVASTFSHELPAYGSQQYYELISKYFQFQPGWSDWYAAVTTAPNQNPELYRYFWNGQDQPNTLFFEGRDRAEEFNQSYRTAGNIIKLLVVNHVISAFDALFTVQLKNSRIETEANLLKMEQFSITWSF